MNTVCPICNKPKSANCSCLKQLNEATKQQTSKQVMIEDATMSTFGFANLSEVKVQK